MSNEQVKRIDSYVNWSFRAMMGLAAFAMSSIYYTMSGDVSDVKKDVIGIRIDMAQMKQRVDDHIDRGEGRDRAIKELQDEINKMKRK